MLKFGVLVPKRAIAQKRIMGVDKHLSALSELGYHELDFVATLLGHCPGRPPKPGAIAVTEAGLVFSQKTRLGGSFKLMQLAHISGYEVSKFLKHHIIKIYSPATSFEFITRMPEKDIHRFVAVFSSKLENNSRLDSN